MNIENFQGLPLNIPWIIVANFSLNFIPWPWKYCPWTCLKIQQTSRLNLGKNWLQILIFFCLNLELKLQKLCQSLKILEVLGFLFISNQLGWHKEVWTGCNCASWFWQTSRNYKDSFKFLEKSSKFLSFQPLHWY